MLRDVEMNHMAALVAQHDEHVKNSKCDSWYSEEVDAYQAFGMIVEERPPVLGRWFTVADHVFGDSGLGDLDAQQAKLTVHTRRTPERVFPGEPANEATHLQGNRRPSTRAMS